MGDLISVCFFFYLLAFFGFSSIISFSSPCRYGNYIQHVMYIHLSVLSDTHTQKKKKRRRISVCSSDCIYPVLINRINEINFQRFIKKKKKKKKKNSKKFKKKKKKKKKKS